jgi:Zn-dependent alcohol dehydrogenase
MAQAGAIVTEAGGPVTIVDDIEIDEPRTGEALIELTAAGVCGSDLSLRDGKMANPMPLLLGHEATGRVVALGPGTPGPAVGTRVILWMRPPCRACRMCRRGEGELCLTSGAMSARGTLLDGRTSSSSGGRPLHRALGIGAFTTRTNMPVTGLVEVPDSVPDDVAALLGCGVATGAGAVLNVARPTPGDVVLVIGGGGVGLAAAMTAAALGAGAIVVADPAEHRRAAALDLGATHVIPGGGARVVRGQLKEAMGDTWVDIAIDAVGRPELVELGFRIVRQGGTVVAVGVQAGDATVGLPGAQLATSHKRVVGCFMGGVEPHRDLPKLFALHQRGALPVERLVGRHRPLAEAAEALDDLAAARGLRTVLDLQA